MFKGQVENKQGKQDVFTGLFGKTVRRENLEDPARQGHLREGMLLEPDMWSAAQQWGLRTPSGRSIGFIEPTPDPNQVKVEDAPRKLQEALRAAEEAERAARGALDRALSRYQAVADSRGEAIRSQDQRAFDQAEGDDAALAAYRDAELDLQRLAARRQDAANALHRWLRLETNMRAAAGGGKKLHPMG